jgi:hypothetical protein
MPNDSDNQGHESAARKIADLLRTIVNPTSEHARIGYCHMGATLSDTVLQAGLNYRTVVLPRVRQILASYPHAETTTKFWKVLSAVGPDKVLQWSHPEKISRLMSLTRLLCEKHLETEPELATWLWSANAASELRAIKGIGPKTVDYLKLLVGIPIVAVDRHVRSLFQLAGLQMHRYDEIRSVLCMAADVLGLEPQVLDGVVWEYFSTRPRRGRRGKTGINGPRKSGEACVARA